jgi:nucleoside-diphosphate kinase
MNSNGSDTHLVRIENGINIWAFNEESLTHNPPPSPNNEVDNEVAVIIIKPDAHRSSLYRDISLEITEMLIEDSTRNSWAKIELTADKETIEMHYSVHKEKPFFDDLVKFTISGNITVFIVKGRGIIEKGQNLRERIRLMHANPLIKRENCIHCSDSIEEGKREFLVWKKFFYEELLK